MKAIDHLESLTTNDLPVPFADHLKALNDVLEKMREDAAKVGVKRSFTLDGRLLGDVGEFLAKVHFGVNLHLTQSKGQDGMCHVSGGSVEVKLRSRSTLVWVKQMPDILVVFYLSPKTYRWGIVCNGPGEALLANATWDARHDRFETNLVKLHQAQASLPRGSLGLIPLVGRQAHE